MIRKGCLFTCKWMVNQNKAIFHHLSVAKIQFKVFFLEKCIYYTNCNSVQNILDEHF